MHILPEPGYEYAEWKVARVGFDYHVEVGAHYYLVPCQHVHAQVAARMTRTTVEVSQCSQRIASHAQCAFQGRHDGRAHAAGTPRHGRLECVGVDGEGRIRGAALRAANTTAAGPKPASTASTVVAWGAAAQAKVRHRPTSGATRPCAQAQRCQLEKRAGQLPINICTPSSPTPRWLTPSRICTLRKTPVGIRHPPESKSCDYSSVQL